MSSYMHQASKPVAIHAEALLPQLIHPCVTRMASIPTAVGRNADNAASLLGPDGHS